MQAPYPCFSTLTYSNQFILFNSPHRALSCVFYSLAASLTTLLLRSGGRAVAAGAQRALSDRRLVRDHGHVPHPRALSERLPQPGMGHHVLYLCDLRAAAHQTTGGRGGRCGAQHGPSGVYRLPRRLQDRARKRGESLLLPVCFF